MGGWRHRPAALSMGKRICTHCMGVCVGARAGVYGCGTRRPHRDSIPQTVYALASRTTDWAIPVFSVVCYTGI